MDEPEPRSSAVGLSWGSWLGGVATISGPSRARAQPLWVWPLPGAPPVLAEFDPPARPWDRGHRGIDLAAAVGSPVTAVADGIVVFSGAIAGVGIVSVRHDNGVRSTYQPVHHRVNQGATVSQGERIGVLGSGGHCLPLACLHLGAVVGRRHYLDPLLFLKAWELSLLPPGRSSGVAGRQRAGPVAP